MIGSRDHIRKCRVRGAAWRAGLFEGHRCVLPDLDAIGSEDFFYQRGVVR
jgi:hypothetical protein